MPNTIKKKKGELIPGTIIECKSGRYVAYYEHRTDIIANGDNEKEARKNLKEMYEIIKKHETEEETEKNALTLPKTYKTKTFKEKVDCI